LVFGIGDKRSGLCGTINIYGNVSCRRAVVKNDIVKMPFANGRTSEPLSAVFASTTAVLYSGGDNPGRVVRVNKECPVIDIGNRTQLHENLRTVRPFCRSLIPKGYRNNFDSAEVYGRIGTYILTAHTVKRKSVPYYSGNLRGTVVECSIISVSA
jgi:hypothetical protein